MRRMTVCLMATAIAFAMAVPAANAGEPNATHQRIDIDDVWSSKKLCDFPYVQRFWGWFGITVVGDPNEPTMEVLAGGQLYVTHTNAKTGFTLTEQAIWTDVYFYEAGRILEAGLYWHLRGPDGKLVLVQAGKVVYDLDYNVITYTPNRALGLPGELAAIICPALGGAPR